MALSHVVSGLLQKRSELMGLIEQKRKELTALQQGLTSIDGTIVLFDPDYDLRSVKAKQVRVQNRLFEHGECSRLILESLRGQSQGLELKTIVDTLMVHKSFDESKLSVVDNSVRKVLTQMLKDSKVIKTGDNWLLI